MIIDSLRQKITRLTCGFKWLVYDNGDWVVYEKPYGRRITREIIRTGNEQEAVETLTRD